MAEQTITLPTTWYSEGAAAVLWGRGSAVGILIDSALTPTDAANPYRFIETVRLDRNSGQVQLAFYKSNSDTGLQVDGTQSDLTDQFEATGGFEITVGSNSLTVELAGADMTEPYAWTPSNSAAVITFANAVFALTGNQSATLRLFDGVTPLPDATAPTVTIADQADIDETETASLSATVSGGTYDALAYAWADGGAGGSFSAQEASTVYTPPDVSSDTSVTVTCTVTATGDGTTAADGTSDTASDTETFTVNFVAPLPLAQAPTVTIAPQADIDENETANLSAMVSGGVYDTLAYAWAVSSGGGSISGSGASVTYTPPDVAADTDVIVECTVTATGTGTNAVLNSNATASDTESFTVRAVIAPATITDYQITSTPAAASDTYGEGETIRFTATFSGPVDVTGTPRFPMNLGESPPGNPEYADYASGSGTNALVFEWVVSATDQDTNGVFLFGPGFADLGGGPRDRLVLNGGTIRNAGTAIDATLAWPSPGNSGTEAGHKVDGPGFPALPAASAPTVTIADQADISENETATLSATVSGGTYDALSYAWSVASGGGTISGTGASVTYTPADVSADTSVTIECTVTATGDGTTAADGTSDTASDTEGFTVRAALPDASAPAVTIASQADIDETETATLSATVSGGTYDTLAYAWSVTSGGGTITGSGASVTYAPADVATDTAVTIECTVTAAGTGTNAADSTSDTASDTETFTVRAVAGIPAAAAPAVTIGAQADIAENETASLSATVSGGAYDTIAYAWTDGGAGGAFSAQAADTVYTPADVAADTPVTVTCTVTVTGTGANAQANTSDTASDTESFTVTVVLPNADAPSVTVAPHGDIAENQTATLSAAVSGGTYDSLAYAWADGGAGGSFSPQAANTVYTPPDVASDTPITVTCTVTATGTGTVAATGTSDTADDSATFTVTAVIALPAAMAPAVTISAQGDIDETDTASLSAGLSGGAYDSLSYAWSDGSAGGGFSTQAQNTIYTPPDVSVDTVVTITCTVTASGTGANAQAGTSDTASDTETFTVRAIAAIPPADAPSVMIVPQGDIDETATASLNVGLEGGAYDALSFAWADGGAGGSFSAQAASTIYTPPDVTSDTSVTVTCTVTATGTGTNALDATSDTASDTETFTVRAAIPLPNAAAPTVAISAQADIDANRTASLLVSVSGGVYDSLAYAWSDGGSGGSFSTQTAGTVYTPPPVSVDAAVTITCEVTATGTGALAAAGTSATASDTESFTVRAVTPSGTRDGGMLVPLITIGSGADIMRLAGHATDITVGANVYAGGKAIGLSPIEETEGTPDNRASISLSLADTADFLRYGVDVGPLPVEIGFARSDDAGATWSALTKVHRGRVSLPSIEGRELSFEIETLRGDVDRGGELVWSHESQQSEFADDNGMEYVRPIATGAVEVAWPP